MSSHSVHEERSIANSRVLAIGFLAYSMLLGTSVPAASKDIDLSNRTEPSGEYFVAFCTRPSPQGEKPGHAFVAFSHRASDATHDFLAVGHTVGAGTGVAAAVWSYFGPAVPGRLKAENYTAIRQNCLNVKVNKDVYDRARSFTADPLAQMGIVPAGSIILQAYKLGDSDCMTFMIKVARTLMPHGLNVPDRGDTEFPMSYMERFVRAN